MKVFNITQINYRPYINSKKENDNKQNDKQEGNITNPIVQQGYRDFNINFRGRTPEDFYAQEFNIKNMPETMNVYLQEDYEKRKHLPPEQVMNQAFKYLNVTENFAEVKSIYPDERLFANLHEASPRIRTGVLSEIRLAKEISDAPLLNDGSDDIGMYILRKVFLEGKTVKEINKDFYEKDLNPEYKGVISHPISYDTTSAFGIQYPKQDFWHSFIATRDDYKKFVVELPKQDKSDLKRELAEKISSKKTSTPDVQSAEKSEKPEKVNKPATRKYSIKQYKKEQIKKDVKEAKGDIEKVKKSIRKHFSQNDPEASFIVKYLSPIMTIAADRIHLSEEEKDFAEMLKAKNKKVEDLFAQFWKAKPELLDYYSAMIADTIELFEAVYEDGGNIPINCDYEVVSEKVENKRAIDLVSPRFLELLDYVQTIVPNRTAKYAKHDELQKEWEEHFDSRYGQIQEKAATEEPQQLKKSMEVLKSEAEKNNAKIYMLHGVNGEDIKIVANLDETFADYVRKINIGMPSQYINILINKALKNPILTENAKLSFSTMEMHDLIDDERIIDSAERERIMTSILSEMRPETIAAEMAMGDVFAGLSEHPEKIYRTLHENNYTDDLQELIDLKEKYGTNPKVMAELNRLYNLYRKPLSDSEVLKVTNIYLDAIRNFDLNTAYSKKSLFCLDDKLIDFIEGLRKSYLKDKTSIKSLKNQVMVFIGRMGFARGLLNEVKSSELKKLSIDEFTHVITSSLSVAYGTMFPLR